MDLSQQELPLTTYFTRGSKGTRSRTSSSKKKKKEKEKSAEDLQSVAHSSKRKNSNVQCPTASPLGSSMGQSESRTTSLQLPTPGTSTRKRKRNGRLKVPATTLPTSTGALLSSVEQNATSPSEENFSQLGFGPVPLKLPRSSREGAEDVTPQVPTPSTDRRRTTKFIGLELPLGNRHSDHGGTGIATPQASSQKISGPVHRVDDCSPLARSNCHLPSNPALAFPILSDSGAYRPVPPHVQLSTRSTADLSSLPVDLDYPDPPDPFCAHDSGFVQRDCTFAPPKQYAIQSKSLDSQLSDGHATPMIPIPSSQSQYLLHPDATPKRERYSRIETVISSQTQEERELALSTPHRPASMVNLSVGVSPGKHMGGNAQILRLSCSKRKGQRVHAFGSTPIGSPINSSVGPSRSALATKNAFDEPSSKPSSPSHRERLTSYHTPSRKAKALRKSCEDSVENIPPAHMEDSLTESESESDILRMKIKARLFTLGPPSRETNQVSCHSPPVARDVCCAPVEGHLPVAEDDSSTEAESDTEILHCVAEIGKRRPRDHRPQVAREDTPPPVISPLVSPARSRIAAVPSITESTQFCTQEGAGLSIPLPSAPYSSTMERPQIPSESLPSVVRDFIRMFPGDESYPADFPESLRI